MGEMRVVWLCVGTLCVYRTRAHERTHTYTHAHAHAHACTHTRWQLRVGGLTELILTDWEGMPVTLVVAGLLERSAATLGRLELWCVAHVRMCVTRTSVLTSLPCLSLAQPPHLTQSAVAPLRGAHDSDALPHVPSLDRVGHLVLHVTRLVIPRDRHHNLPSLSPY